MKTKNKILTSVISTIVLMAIGLSALSANAQTLKTSGVIGESISFLQAQSNIPRVMEFDFSITDGNGVISGPHNGVTLSLAGEASKPNLTPTLGGAISSPTGTKVFLSTKSAGTYRSTRSTESGQTFTAQTSSAALSTGDGLTISYWTGNGTVINKVGLGDNLTVIKISASSAGENEYVIFGIIDPANPKRVVTLHLRQRIIYSG